jgi:hypothetical protein
MNKFICILLLAVVLTNAQDIPWDGNYTVISVTNSNGTDTTQCCVPTALNAMRDLTDTKLITLDLDFGAGMQQCDPTLIGMINIQQAENFGRLYLNDSSTTLTGAMVVYLLNNGTILLKLQDGCQISYGNGTVTANNDTNYKERFEGIWVMDSSWSTDGNPCCKSFTPIAFAFDDYTKTHALVDVYGTDPVCPEADRNTITAYNLTVDGFGILYTGFSEFLLPNGSALTLHAAPYCNVLYRVVKPDMSTNLCDYVNETMGNNTVNETASTTDVATTDSTEGTTGEIPADATATGGV